MTHVEPHSDVIRRFNRYYIEQIGILSDRYLGQTRPLAEARLLFEIGSQTRPVRELRLGLDLDSGYLARLLRSLEHQGLVTLAADPDDRRARIAMLTAAGTKELRDLNQRADAAADELLGRLSERDRAQVLDAMTSIHRLLRRAEITANEADPGSPDAQRCLLAYADELDHRFPEGFAPSDLVSSHPTTPIPTRTYGSKSNSIPSGKYDPDALLRPLDVVSRDRPKICSESSWVRRLDKVRAPEE